MNMKLKHLLEGNLMVAPRESKRLKFSHFNLGPSFHYIVHRLMCMFQPTRWGNLGHYKSQTNCKKKKTEKSLVELTPFSQGRSRHRSQL